ncbi:ferritin-like domain-containing protein [Leptolyngbya sp. 'hensonii']|uniref:ferritin-like domain-containing protein n=1 Tax=Leptolyngbya sp. 'hensonii' TaxID=1922337 RepID=UPI00209B8F6D|nr:ferritin-like domain-containing protein [Leptolyngbya sp. 'hensonii']
MDLPILPAENPLQRILRSALPDRMESVLTGVPYWNAAHFGLDRVSLFREATLEQQQAMLTIASTQLLQESCAVEQAGMGYMTRMALLAETLEERMLYSLFAADEATHLAQLQPFLPAAIVTPDPFLQLLTELAESSDKTVLLFMIQVLLEGWGLSHYRSLARDCSHPVLADRFREFLQAEARHHATGVTLFRQTDLTRSSRSAILEILVPFLQLVQPGPQRLVQAIAQVQGDLSPSQRLQIFTELDTETHSGMRLQLLRSLMQSGGGGTIVQDLEEQGAFQPFSPEQCAHIAGG